MSREVMLINTQIAKLVEAMEPRHIALLMEAIKSPDKPLIELSGELWPDLGYARRRQIIAQSNVSKVIGLVRSRPFALAALMATKLAPVVTATLFELSQTAGKENVRATAAKELLRLAQSMQSKLQASDEEPEPTEEHERLLEDAAPDDEDEQEAEDDQQAAPLSLADLEA